MCQNFMNNYDKVLVEILINQTLKNTVSHCRKVVYHNGKSIQYFGVKIKNNKIVVGTGRWEGDEGVNFVRVNSEIFLRNNVGVSSPVWDTLKDMYRPYSLVQ